MLKTIIKRDGRKVPYDVQKIRDVVIKAANVVSPETEAENVLLAETVAQAVEKSLLEDFTSRKSPTVEQVQDVVENTLVAGGHTKVAKEYILYRAERNRVREMNAELMKTYEGLTFQDSKESDLKRENANIDANTAMGIMLKYGSEGAKQFNHLYLLDREASEAHLSGDIHIHDLDFAGIGTLTCVQSPLDKIFKGGFSTGHGYLREPESIRSYSALTAIVLQCCQNEMHGGQSIPALDYYLTPGVAKTYISEICRILDNKFDLSETLCKSIKVELKSCLAGLNFHIISDEGKKIIFSVLNKYTDLTTENITYTLCKALKYTDKETYQAMEALVHNLNSMHSRAGAQVPFTSINMGTDTSEEGRIIIRNILLATEAGLGAGETAIFPISIFKVKEGVNYNPGDPNYDLFKLSLRVSAKRLFPTYEFVDVPFNKQYLKGNDITREIATMGCVNGVELITYKIGKEVYVEPFKKAWERLSAKNSVEAHGKSEYCALKNVTIFDSASNAFVECKKIIRNPDKGDWFRVTCENGRTLLLTSDHPLHLKDKGRTFMRDIQIGDLVEVTNQAYSQGSKEYNTDVAWGLGLTLCDGKYDGGLVISLGVDEDDIIKKYQQIMLSQAYTTEVVERHRGVKGNYKDVVIRGVQKPYCDTLFSLFGAYPKRDRVVPSEVFGWCAEARKAFLCGMIDADGNISAMGGSGSRVQIGSTNPMLALGQMLLVQSLGLHAKCYVSTYGRGSEYLRYRIEFETADWMKTYLSSEKKSMKVGKASAIVIPNYCSVMKVEKLGDCNEFSYDVETVSDRFDVSGFASHNCRTRVIGNVYDPSREVVTGRGNTSFTSINLPRLGILADKDIDKFFELLEDRMNLVKRQILKRFEFQCSKHVYNFPFLMGQGIWLDSEKLGPEDTLETVVPHGSLSIGFLGLAECLVALIGKHHGESDEAQELGLKIVGFMRGLTDKWQQEDYIMNIGKTHNKAIHLNWSILGTPAEGLSGTFVRKDKKKFGIIKGVTDKDYYTNSSHIPVWYQTSFVTKIKKEAPYHALENAGHICYIEFDGDATHNLEAFESIIRCMKENGVGYGAVNIPVDRDPVCGYTGIIGDICPKCGRDVTAPISQEEIDEIRKKYSILTPYNLSTSCREDC